MTKPNPGDPMTTLPPFAMSRAVKEPLPPILEVAPLARKARLAGALHSLALAPAVSALVLLGFIVVSPWAGAQRAAFIPEVVADVVTVAFFSHDDNVVLFLVSGIETVVRITGAVLVALVVAGVVVARRAGATARHGGLAVLLLAPVFVYLAADDAEFDRPVNFAELDATAPGADEAERILMTWTFEAAISMAFKEPAIVATLRPGPDQPEWPELVRKNRVQIAAAWEEIAPLHAWWGAWNAYPEVADSTRASDDPIVSFTVLKA